MPRWLIWFPSLWLMLGCAAQQTHLPQSLRGKPDPGERSLIQAIELVQAGDAPVVYQSFAEGEPQQQERQWTAITQRGPQRYHSLEVYNVYVDAQQRTEYFVQEFSVDLGDTTNRVEVRDYRFLATPDTAYYTDITQRGLRVRDRWTETDSLTVYEMEGFEYLDSPDHGQLKYWTPQVGTILQYFGQGETFELIETGSPTLDRTLVPLRDEIRAQWQKH